MASIRAAHYGETEQALTNDSIVRQTASQLPWNELKEQFTHGNGEPTFEFMMRANETYRERGGEFDGPLHIGAIATAIIMIIEEEA